MNTPAVMSPRVQVAQDYSTDEGGGGARRLKEMMGSMGAMGLSSMNMAGLGGGGSGSGGGGKGAAGGQGVQLAAGSAATEALECLLEAMRSFERSVVGTSSRESVMENARAEEGGRDRKSVV